MNLSQFHFAHPLWLLLWLFIPLVALLFYFYNQKNQPSHSLEKWIDKHLIPHLLVKGKANSKKAWNRFFFWSFVWFFLVLALAGPRSGFREIATFTRDQSLVVLLDLSESMNAQDITPSRLGRAKQKIEDLLHLSKGVKIGLIAFAADPHMIVPLTDDKETIRHLLPSIDTDLVYIQGSKLAPALEMASTMLENEPGHNQAILVISDGGFESLEAMTSAKKIAEKGIVIYTLGVGSLEGSPLKSSRGEVVKKSGSVVLSKLEKEKLREISKIGHGRYFEGGHDHSLSLIVEDLEKRSDLQEQTQQTQKIWEESFYFFLLPLLPFFLYWFRRGTLFSMLGFMLLPGYLQASVSDYFYNQEQLANQVYEVGEYETASHLFEDPYRKGVCYYRMGEYPKAEAMFRQSTRPEVASSAAYNLANSLVQQHKLQEAIEAYERVLKSWPDHKEAKENLDLVKKMLEEQKKPSEQTANQGEDQEKDSTQQNQDSSKSQQASKEENSTDSERKNSTQANSQNDSSSLEKEKEQPQEAEEASEASQNPQGSQPRDSAEEEESASEKTQSQESSTSEASDESQPIKLQDVNQADAPSSENASQGSTSQDLGQAEKDSPSSESQSPSDRHAGNLNEKSYSQQAEEENQPPLSQVEPLPFESTGQKPKARSQEDVDADLWLNRIKNDPKPFLKNKFYIESKKKGTQQEADPW